MMLTKILIIMTMILAVSSRGGVMRRSERMRTRAPPVTTRCFQRLWKHLEEVDRGKTCDNLKEAYCLRENSFRVPRTELVNYVRDFAIEFDFKLKVDPATKIRYLERSRPRIPIIIYVFHDIDTGKCNYEFDDSISRDMRILVDREVMSKAPSDFVRSRTRAGTATNRDRKEDCELYQGVDEENTMEFVQVNANSKVRMEDGFEWIENAIIGTRADLVNGDWPSDLDTTIIREKFPGFIALERSHGENKRLSILVERKETDDEEGSKQHIDSIISIYSSCGGVDLHASLYVENIRMLERLTQKNKPSIEHRRIADANFLFKLRLLESEPDCDVSGRTYINQNRKHTHI